MERQSVHRLKCSRVGYTRLTHVTRDTQASKHTPAQTQADTQIPTPTDFRLWKINKRTAKGGLRGKGRRSKISIISYGNHALKTTTQYLCAFTDLCRARLYIYRHLSVYACLCSCIYLQLCIQTTTHAYTQT